MKTNKEKKEKNKMPEEKLSVPVGDDDHSQGSKGAKITLAEYGDYECPYCGQAYSIVKKIQEEMGDDLRFVFRNFPLTQVHPNALHAAEAAEIAGEQGKFWEMHDALFENQKSLGDESLKRYAEQIGLDAESFAMDLDGDRFEEKVRTDFMNGVESGVNGTPTFFINGVRFDGSWEYESLLEALRNA